MFPTPTRVGNLAFPHMTGRNYVIPILVGAGNRSRSHCRKFKIPTVGNGKNFLCSVPPYVCHFGSKNGPFIGLILAKSFEKNVKKEILSGTHHKNFPTFLKYFYKHTLYLADFLFSSFFL